MSTARRTAGLVGVALLTAGASLAPAAAKSTDPTAHPDTSGNIRVSGQQIPVDVAQGRYVMRGDLIGTWRYIPRTVLHEADTLYAEAGVEVFNGCIDLRRNRRCDRRDPSGELHLSFIYWASFDLAGNLIKGQCVHPVTGGKGDFAGARGRLDMVDTPVGTEVRTTYRGHIALDAVPTEGEAPTPAAGAPPLAGQTTTTSLKKGC